MINLVTTNCRITLGKSRYNALSGKLSEAVAMLDAALASSGLTEVDQFALTMAKVEYLHWDSRDEEALALIQERIDPLLPSVPDELAVIASYNRSDVSFALFRPAETDSELAEYLQLHLWEHEPFIFARRAADQGKHYQSYPLLWRELHRTLLQGCWRPFRFASSYMALECVKVGMVEDAVFHAIMCGDESTCKEIGIALSQVRDAPVVSLAVAKVLEVSHLKRFAMAGAHILAPCCDLIPDSQVTQVYDWAIERAKIIPTQHGHGHVLTTAWSILARIANRLSREQAIGLLDAATNHPAWKDKSDDPKRVTLFRKEMLEALHAACCKYDAATLKRLANAVMPLAMERRQDYDYAEAINVLCEIASRGGDKMKQRIKGTFYAKGQRFTYLSLFAANHFGYEVKKPEDLAKDAEQVALNISRQVQRVPPGTEPENVSGVLYTQHRDMEDVRHVISIVSTYDVMAIIVHRKVIAHRVIAALVRTMCDMIAERENAIANRVGLIEALKDLGDSAGGILKRRIWASLSPLALGSIEESTVFMTDAQAKDPFNRFKMSTGSPLDVQAHAIHALAILERDNPGLWDGRLDGIVGQAVMHKSHLVRSAGCAAADEMPEISASTLQLIHIATQDNNSEVAATAFCALGSKLRKSTREADWQSVVASLERAADSSQSVIRRAAASCIAMLVDKCDAKACAKRLGELRKRLLSDVCHSIRWSAANSESGKRMRPRRFRSRQRK